MTMDQLAERFGIPSAVACARGPGGRTRMDRAAVGGAASVYLQGAHVAHWQPAEALRPVIWVSARSAFGPGQAIRGGVPVCFPWFANRPGDPAAPLHGFARNLVWEVESARREAGGEVVATFLLRADDRTRACWDGEFELRHTITLGRTLAMALEVRNVGQAEFAITEALHTYFCVSDVREIAVDGLGGTEYIDKVDQFRRKRQPPGPLTLTGMTDRVYVNTQSECVLTDPGLGRRIRVAKQGSDTTVVWNPWQDKAAAMPDFGDDEWPQMICLETANAGAAGVTVLPGQVHTMRAEVSVESGAPLGPPAPVTPPEMERP